MNARKLSPLLTLCLLWLVSTMAHGYDFKAGDLYYKILSETDMTVAVTYPNSEPPTFNPPIPSEYDVVEVIIPVEVIFDGKQYTVTAIGESAFYNCTALNSIIIPTETKITTIGKGAFLGCSNLTSAPIPNGIVSIGGWAFQKCKNLTSVNIPSSVKSIGTYAFSQCTNLTSITLPNSITAIEEAVFMDCSSLTTVIIPNNVTIINKNAFMYNAKLASITIGSGVREIKDNAFFPCTSLRTVTCLARTAPKCGIDIFGNNRDGRTLYVPDGCIDSYNDWSAYFQVIKEQGCQTKMAEVKKILAEAQKVKYGDGTFSEATVKINSAIENIENDLDSLQAKIEAAGIELNDETSEKQDSITSKLKSVKKLYADALETISSYFTKYNATLIRYETRIDEAQAVEALELLKKEILEAMAQAQAELTKTGYELDDVMDELFDMPKQLAEYSNMVDDAIKANEDQKAVAEKKAEAETKLAAAQTAYDKSPGYISGNIYKLAKKTQKVNQIVAEGLIADVATLKDKMTQAEADQYGETLSEVANAAALWQAKNDTTFTFTQFEANQDIETELAAIEIDIDTAKTVSEVNNIISRISTIVLTIMQSQADLLEALDEMAGHYLTISNELDELKATLDDCIEGIAGAPESLKVAVGENGLATYCPEYGVDFNGATQIAAYKAAVIDNRVSLTRVDTVAAGEGVLLRSLNGSAAKEELPTTADAVKAEDNAFVGTLEAINPLPKQEGNATNFVLAKRNDVVGFYTSTNMSIEAGKAYLPVEDYNATRSLTITFSDTTGIIEIAPDQADGDDAIYTLGGVRVKTPVKGIYIKNGKKVVVK